MTGAQLFLVNNILENSKIAICLKKSKTNHQNQQLLMMALLQHQKLINASFRKIILLSSCQKKHCCNHVDDSAETIGIFGITFAFIIPKQDSEVALGIQGRRSRIF